MFIFSITTSPSGLPIKSPRPNSIVHFSALPVFKAILILGIPSKKTSIESIISVCDDVTKTKFVKICTLFKLPQRLLPRNGLAKIRGTESSITLASCQWTERDICRLVCEELNHRVQAFKLSGEFVTKFGAKGTRAGEFNVPGSTAVLSDGKIIVTDYNNHRVQIFE